MNWTKYRPLLWGYAITRDYWTYMLTAATGGVVGAYITVLANQGI